MPAACSVMFRWQSCQNSSSTLPTSSMPSLARCRITPGFLRTSVKPLSVNTRPFMNDSGGRFAPARSRPSSLPELLPDLARHRFCLAERGCKRACSERSTIRLSKAPMPSSWGPRVTFPRGHPVGAALDEDRALQEELFTAAAGRRAVEHPPQPGFRWRRGFALSVVNVTGHLLTPRRWGTRVSWEGLIMTKDASFKKVVRRHAEETGQRYTEALTDLEGLGARMHHEPAADRLLAHLRDRYGIDPVTATKLSVHKTYVFRIDRNDGSPWVARAFPPARPRAGVEGDAAILRFLERQNYPAERLAADDAVSDFDGSAVLVTRFVEGVPLPDGAAKFAMMGELLGRLHALPYDDSVSRPGGASGEDPSHEGTPRQDLLASLSFLDAVDTKVSAAERERFEQLRDQVRSADDGHGLPEGLLHGNLLHAPDHAVLSELGPVAINWKASGRGPRLADFAYLIWGTGSWNPRRPNQEWIDAAVNAYRRHVEPTEDELDRLEAVMYIRTLYLACFGYRRAVTNGSTFNEWGFIEPPEYFSSTAAAVRAAFRR